VPRKIAKGNDTPRRRGARAVAAQVDERGLAMRILLHSPKDTAVGALAFVVVTAIVANALLLQKGYHPAPIFGSVPGNAGAGSAASAALPRPRPIEFGTAVSASTPAEPKQVSNVADLKLADPVGSLVKATAGASATASAALRPPQTVPVSGRNDISAGAGSRRIATVQRALTDYGYGQLKPTGTVGTDTQAAIQKFEREHKWPLTGQISDRLVRELAQMIGHSID
jgi:Putative peptidoglycan binding domain